MDVFNRIIRRYVPTNVVYVNSMWMDDVCRMLRNLLVHKENNRCFIEETKQQTILSYNKKNNTKFTDRTKGRNPNYDTRNEQLTERKSQQQIS